MTKEFTKGEIDRLGNLIREQGANIQDDTLLDLQSYRTSHKELLSSTFNMLCSLAKRIHPETIVSYRIKRFESIISKLNRYPKMRFSRMWDIGGCRCIVRHDNDVYKFEKLLNDHNEFEIVKRTDYIKEPQKDGYKSLHLFVKHKSNDKIIEVQLRNQKDHNWATLVEITDLLYDSKLKELAELENGAKDSKLYRFHFLLAQIDEVEIDEKKEIASIIKEYSYFETLSEVFSRNHLRVRKQWLDIESRYNHKYFLIETTKDDVPKIKSFNSSVSAENEYFNLYKGNQNANIVLTHLQKPNYQQISIAYSNYILTYHSFLEECMLMLESIIQEALSRRELRKYHKTFHLYNNLVLCHSKNLLAEIIEFKDFSNRNKKKTNNDRKKEKEWVGDIKKQLRKSEDRAKRLGQKLQRYLPSKSFSRFLFMTVTQYNLRIFRTKLKRAHKKYQLKQE